jgi:hypothetical protein
MASSFLLDVEIATARIIRARNQTLLTSGFVDRAAGTAAALANIQRNFVAKFYRLKIRRPVHISTIATQYFAALGRMVAKRLTDLARPILIYSSAADAGSHRLARDGLAGDPTSGAMSFAHLVSPTV